MRPTHKWLADLIGRVPVLAIDVAEAKRTGNVAAIAYAEAICRWQEEAALAVAEAAQVRASGSGSRKPDAFARTANAAALMRLDAAE